MQPENPILEPLDGGALSSKVENVLETMCFVIADPAEPPNESAQSEGTLFRSWISYTGEHEEGRVELFATPEFVAEAAAGLLGVDEDEVESEHDVLETLLELANIIGGEVVALIGGEDVFFEMGLPSEAPLALQGVEDQAAVAFDSMGELFGVKVTRRSLMSSEGA